MYNQLIDFVEKKHLLYQFQFDFRKNHSTFMALVIYTNASPNVHWCANKMYLGQWQVTTPTGIVGYSTGPCPSQLLPAHKSSYDSHPTCILIDFRKTLDTVEHEILLEKLFHRGIRGTALQWFDSYHLKYEMAATKHYEIQ